MSYIYLGSAVIGATGSMYTANKNAKALKGAQGQPLDISKIIADARTSASENLANSINLENTFRPGTAALRTATDNSLGNLSTGNTAGFQARDSLLSTISDPRVTATGSNPLLEASAASILDNLKLGGALGRDVQQQTVKAALEKGGMAGISGSGAGRGLVARDVGLTSLGLLQQRQTQAMGAGATLEGLKIQAQQARLNDFLGRLGAAGTAAGQDAQRTGLLASIVDARALPESGLSPGALANLYVGDKNAQDQQRMDFASASAARNTSTMNALLGFGTQAAGAYFGAPKKAGSGAAGGGAWQPGDS